ncbi:MAG: hypothetical protein EA369_05670 [Bradymonadales bacterium]|nr:MAG: hypothetical protein EA369_05670 [Bradymonadales bacterium]
MSAESLKSKPSGKLDFVDRAEAWIHSSLGIFAGLIIFPLFLMNLHIWTFQHGSFILPLNLEFFSWLFEAGHNQRMVFPSWAQHPIFLFLCLAGPILGALTLSLVHKTLAWPKDLSFFMALILIASLYPQFAPGQSPVHLLYWLSALSLLYLASKSRPPALAFAGLGVLILWLALSHPFFWFNAFWGLFSFGLSAAVAFLLADRAHIPYRDRLNRSSSLLFALACFFLALLGLGLFGMGSWPKQGFGPASFWWIAYLNLALAGVYSWKSPWETQRSLRLATLGLGPLISPYLEILGFLVCAYWVLEILRLSLPWAKLSLTSFVSIKLLALSLSLSIVCFHFFAHAEKREFKPEWVSVLKQLQPFEPEGIVLFGNALPYFAHFYRGPIFQNPDVFLLREEREFESWMNEKGARHLVIDQNFLSEVWKELIQEKASPEDLNHSLLSRLSIYRGEALQTATLSFSAVERFRIQSSEPKNFLIVELQSGDVTE